MTPSPEPGRLRRRIYEVLEVADPGDVTSRVFDLSILTLISANVLAMVLETVDPIRIAYGGMFRTFGIVSLAVFTLEYIARLWACTAAPAYRRPVLGRLRYAVRPLVLVDLAAILPFLLPILGIDLRVLRAVRLYRIFWVAKLGRYSRAVRTLGRVVTVKREELLASTVVLLILLLLASSLMYYAERAAQPEAFSSIPDAMWWAIATLTTVGYGDVFPVTPVGRMLASIIAVLGIGMFALPTGILGAGFVDELEARTEQARSCPHCGKPLDAPVRRALPAE